MGNFDMLPEEIMLEILYRVPAESVIECKSVSKRWRNLLQNPSFSQLHLNHHLRGFDSAGKLSFIFHTPGNGEPYYYAKYDENLNSFTRRARINLRAVFKNSYILGSVNGLVCFNTYLDGHYVQPAYICNPITREYIVLPNLERKQLLYGFGYSPLTKEYKVVRIPYCRSDPNYGIAQVYTLGSGMGWRNVKKVCTNVVNFHQGGVFVNGSIHWLEYRKQTLFSFDLFDEEFRELPSQPWLSSIYVDLHVLGDFLCASVLNAEGLDLWVLKKNKSNNHVNWSKEFRNIKGKPMNFTKSGGILCCGYHAKNVYFYASKASSSRMLVNSGSGSIFYYGVPHKNALVSLKTLGEEHTKVMDSGERARFNWETERHWSFVDGQKEERDL